MKNYANNYEQFIDEYTPNKEKNRKHHHNENELSYFGENKKKNKQHNTNKQ